MSDCPICTRPLLPPFVSCSGCNWRTGDIVPVELSQFGQVAQQARERYVAGASTSADLTDQQWYNVCKHFRFVAVHCKRERPIVGPGHPLDATATVGPLMRGMARATRHSNEDDLERAAIQTQD